MTLGWLVPHPRRTRVVVDGVVVYCDDRGPHNQDPYVWNHRFLHSYCHITQMSAKPGDVCLWVSPQPFPDFTRLPCDLVFVVDEKVFWADANRIHEHEDLVDSPEAFLDHYRWHTDHPRMSSRRRYTLKADATRSFQAQLEGRELVDILPLLVAAGFDRDALRQSMRAGFMARPVRIPSDAAALVASRLEASPVLLYGDDLQRLRRLAEST